MVKLFGSTLAETKAALGSLHFGGEQPTTDDKTKAIGRIIVSVLLVLLAFFLFAKNKNDVAGTIVGALVGYWVK